MTSTTSIASSCTVKTTDESGSYTVIEPTISRANYNPLGYDSSSTATTGSTPYVGGGTRTLTSNITLYAITELSDTDPPTCTAVTPVCLKKGSDTALTKFVTSTDAESDIKEDSITAKIGSTTVTDLSSYGTGSYTVTYTATDNADNVSTAVTSTINIYSKIVGDQTAYTVGTHTVDGLYNDPYTDGRYIFRGSDLNNYVTFNGETWRILAIEADGTYKITLAEPLSTSRPYHSSSSGLLTFTNTDLYKYLNTSYYDDNFMETLSDTAKSQMVIHDFPGGVLGYAVTSPASSTEYTIAQTIPLEHATYYNGYVGLPSITDYLRASSNCTDSDEWDTINASPYKCKENNWMAYLTYSWYFLNPYSSTYSYHLSDTGQVGAYDPIYGRKTRPTLYLSNLTTFTGSGTSSDPYVINSSCETGPNATSYVTCTLEAEDGWLETQTLTIKPSATTGVTYSFDGTTYNSATQKNVSAAGTYNAYVKDSDGGTNSCSVSLASRTEYQSTSCPTANLSFSSWSTGSLSYVSSCSAYSRTSAEANYSSWARECPDKRQYTISNCSGWNGTHTESTSASCSSICSQMLSGECAGQLSVTCSCKVASQSYSRTGTCSSFDGGTVSGWQTTEITADFKTQVETRITYAVG